MRFTLAPVEKDSWLKKQGVTLMLLFAFLLTTLLVQQQQRTIESQRLLIRDLLGDSVQLANMRIKAAKLAHEHSTNR